MKELFSFLDPEPSEISAHKYPAVLMVLKRKYRTQKDWMISSLNQYQFTQEEAEKVKKAILNGDLRVTDILQRNLSHHLWSFLTFKWGEIIAGGKRLSKDNVLQIATYSSNGQAFVRTPTQNRNRLIKGVPLVIGKVLTSMALCMVFCLGLLSTLGVPFGASLFIGTLLSLCNGTVCLLSRGKVMLDSAGFNPKKQKTLSKLEDNEKEKTISSRGQKLFFGIVTLLGCISAGISGYAGIGGLLSFLGWGMLASNPLILAVTISLCVITAVSFYSFQAMGIRENYTKFKNLFIENYQKPFGFWRCLLLGAVSASFLTVYATLTWFTAASGVNKLFSALGANGDTFLSSVLSAMSTSTTMVVNTFSQVYKVFNPATYTDLKEKFKSIYQTPDEQQGFVQTIKYRTKNTLKLCALIGDSLAYSVAGGIRSGIHVGGTIGEKIGAKVALTITMAIFSPVILAFVSIAFTWPTVFDKKKSVQPPSKTEESFIEKAVQGNAPLGCQENTVMSSISKKDSTTQPMIKQTGIGFFDSQLKEVHAQSDFSQRNSCPISPRMTCEQDEIPTVTGPGNR